MSSGILNPSKPVRVCMIQTNPVWGACEKYMALLAEGLDPERFAVEIVYSDCEVLRAGFGRLPARVIQRPVDPVLLRSIPRGHFRLAALLQKIDPQIVHCNDPAVAAMAAAQRLPSAKKILTFHTPSQPFGYRPWIAWLHRRLIRSGWEVIIVGEANRGTANRLYGIPDNRLHTIECGIDPVYSMPHAAARSRRRAAWGVSEETAVFVCAARLDPQKNHDLLLTAYAALPENLRRRSRLVLAGEGSLGNHLRGLCSALRIQNEVIFTGYENQVHELLAASDVQVLASHYEGLPFAIIESLAAGIPVIATSVDGNRNAVVHGMNGFLTRPGSVEDLTEAMAKLIDSPEERSRMGEQGKKIYARSFSAERMTGLTQDLYAAVMGRTPPVSVPGAV